MIPLYDKSTFPKILLPKSQCKNISNDQCNSPNPPLFHIVFIPEMQKEGSTACHSCNLVMNRKVLSKLKKRPYSVRPGGPFQSSFVNFSCFSAKSGPLNSMSLKAKVLCCTLHYKFLLLLQSEIQGYKGHSFNIFVDYILADISISLT